MSYLNNTLAFYKIFHIFSGSVVTFNPNIPGRQESLTWQKALEFCTSLKDSLGMAPDPKYQRPYFEEAYWTTVIRAVDWNYDTCQCNYFDNLNIHEENCLHETDIYRGGFRFNASYRLSVFTRKGLT